MKKLLSIMLAIIVAQAGISQTKISDVAKFSSATINLGKLKQGEPATAIFDITNISQKPLVIKQASPACGCTVADYTKTPIQPGEKGTVKATYNAANTGSFHKTISVKFAGVDETQIITLNGEVVAPNRE